jgi:hypothetical protein
VEVVVLVGVLVICYPLLVGVKEGVLKEYIVWVVLGEQVMELVEVVEDVDYGIII